jgi:hypothetical protein
MNGMFGVGMREQISSAATVLVMFLWGSTLLLAQESILDVEPIPESVDQVVTPMELAFQEKRRVPRFFPC